MHATISRRGPKVKPTSSDKKVPSAEAILGTGSTDTCVSIFVVMPLLRNSHTIV